MFATCVNFILNTTCKMVQMEFRSPWILPVDVARETVFQPLHPDTEALLRDEHVVAFAKSPTSSLCFDGVDADKWIMKEDSLQIEDEFVDAVDQNTDGNKDPDGVFDGEVLRLLFL